MRENHYGEISVDEHFRNQLRKSHLIVNRLSVPAIRLNLFKDNATTNANQSWILYQRSYIQKVRELEPTLNAGSKLMISILADQV